MPCESGNDRIRLVDENYSLDDLSVLAAIAVGQPGKRTFFLALGQSGKWFRLWLEKEDLRALAMAIRKFLFGLSQTQPGFSSAPAAQVLSSDPPPGLPSAELEIEEMTLGYEGGKALLDFKAHRSGAKSADKVTMHNLLSIDQLRNLANQAERVCAAGRPLCPVCGQPMDPSGHVCPGEN